MSAKCWRVSALQCCSKRIKHSAWEYDRKVETQRNWRGPHKRWSMWFNSKQREELTRSWHPLTTLEIELSLGAKWQVVHGCRQLVSWDVGLSPATSATLIVSCHHLVGHSSETAGDKPEEGGDDVKSSCPLWPGHTCYNGKYNELRSREAKLIS